MYKTYSRKQANVIYRASKEGHITISKQVMSKIYDMADESCEYFFDGYDMHERIPMIVQNIFDGNYKMAQQGIDEIAA